jgi:hypothetical protein
MCGQLHTEKTLHTVITTVDGRTPEKLGNESMGKGGKDTCTPFFIT